MAAIAHASRVNATAQTTTSTTYVDATNGDIASGSFTTGKKYLIIASAQFGNGSADTGSLQAVHGTTAFADSELAWNPNSQAHSKAWSWWTVPAVTGDVWMGTYFTYDAVAANNDLEFRIQRDDADEPAGQTTANYAFDAGTDTTDDAPILSQCIPSLTAATAYVFDVDASATLGSPNGMHRSLWAVTMELPATATGWGPTINGPLSP